MLLLSHLQRFVKSEKCCSCYQSVLELCLFIQLVVTLHVLDTKRGAESIGVRVLTEVMHQVVENKLLHLRGKDHTFSGIVIKVVAADQKKLASKIVFQRFASKISSNDFTFSFFLQSRRVSPSKVLPKRKWIKIPTTFSLNAESIPKLPALKQCVTSSAPLAVTIIENKSTSSLIYSSSVLSTVTTIFI